jgi:primosomal replication protein N
VADSSAGLNRVQLDAGIVERDALRMTPAAVPVLEGRLSYEGDIVEAKLPRRIEFELGFVGIGPVAQALGQAQLGKRYRFDGFLARKSRHTQKLVLHVQGFEELKD